MVPNERRTDRARSLEPVLRPGEDCLACPPGDPDALASAITRLLDDEGFAEGLGRAARAHVLDRFGPARQAERLAAILTERFGLSPSAPVVARAADA